MAASAATLPASRLRNGVPEGCPLTPRELAAVKFIGEGLTYIQIAQRVKRSPSTIRTQLHKAYHRLGVASGAQAVIACANAGWISRRDQPDNAAAQAVILERLLGNLTMAVRARREHGLTLTQRRYLDAFEEHLYASGPAAVRVTEDRLSVAFGAMCAESGINIERTASQKPGAGPLRKFD